MRAMTILIAASGMLAVACLPAAAHDFDGWQRQEWRERQERQEWRERRADESRAREWRERRADEWRAREWRERRAEEWRDREGYAPFGYAAPPPAYYAPPPVYLPAPGIGFSFGIR